MATVILRDRDGRTVEVKDDPALVTDLHFGLGYEIVDPAVESEQPVSPKRSTDTEDKRK